MAYRHRVQKRASGGRVQLRGQQVIDEAKADNDGFKRGGKAGKKDGGMADGKKGMERMDKPRRASGGRVAMARGGSPFSAAGKGGSDAPKSGSECA